MNRKIFTVGIQHAGDIEIFLGDVECGVQVFEWIVFGEFAVIDQVGSVSVDESTEGQTILEGQVEVLNIYVLVRCSLALAPEK